MRLTDYIRRNKEPILQEWETFAASLLPAAANMTQLALRDHAEQILAAIEKDLTAPQTRHEQSEKSKGRAPLVAGAPETAAQTHAVLRAQGGFDIIQLVAEYRALRASVLRLWADASTPESIDVEDMIRFNEAIDQAVAESVGHFHAQLERSRNLLLGMLGHDMRSPLSTVLATATYLSALNAGEDVSAAAARLIRSGASIQALLDDLVDFNRTSLGLGIRITPSDVDLVLAVTDEIEQLRGAHPDRRIDLAVTGDCQGRVDALRLKQLLRNLVSNAIKYGSPATHVRVALSGEAADIFLQVTNSGPPIDAAALSDIFDPLRRGTDQRSREDHGDLGLGLFIVREIAHAHGGEVQVQSNPDETAFTVRLPRRKGGSL